MTPARLQPVTLSLLRLVVGLCFLEHGTAKLFGFPADPRYLNGHLSPLMILAGILEAVGGALITLGWFTRPVAFLISGEMAVAYFMAHAPRSVFPAINGGDAAILAIGRMVEVATVAAVASTPAVSAEAFASERCRRSAATMAFSWAMDCSRRSFTRI